MSQATPQPAPQGKQAPVASSTQTTTSKQYRPVAPQFAAKSAHATPSIAPAQTQKPAATQPATPPKKKMPLYVPRAQNWDEEPLPINSNNIYQLLTAPVNKTLDELVKDPGMPILAFTGTLLQEIRYITNKLSNSEYAVFLALRRIDRNHPHFLAYDFFMPEQKASGGGVSLDPKDCQRHFDGLKTHPWYHENGLHRHLCHLHSHAGMGVFWSATDDTQQLSRDDLGFMDDYRFYCVVNTRDEIKCSFVFYKPVLARVDAAVAVSFSGQDHAEQLTRKRRQELDDMIDATMSGYSPTAQHVSEFGGSGFGGTVGQGDNAKGNSFYYGGAGEKPGNFRGGWDGDWRARPAARASRFSQRDAYDEYWDSFHGRNGAGYGWSGANQYGDASWDSKNWADPENQPITLDWFSFLDAHKCSSKIPDDMLQAFLSNANVERKYAKRARKVLSWVLDEVFGKTEATQQPDLAAAGAMSSEEASMFGEIIGNYVQELTMTMREGAMFGDDYEYKDYLSEQTCIAIRSNNKERIIECAMQDLSTALMDALE